MSTLFGACAAVRGGSAGTTDAPNLAGTWEGFHRASLRNEDGQPDVRIERQAWQIEQDGRDLRGQYIVELTMISGDGRSFLCSRTPRFTTLLRFQVRGRLGAEGFELQEVGDMQARGPCRPNLRTPARFRGRLTGGVLTLVGAGRKQTLYRRPPDQSDVGLLAETFDPTAPAAAAAAAAAAPQVTFPASLPGNGDDSAAPADVQGLWVWESESRLANGDVKREREEWHLMQDGPEVSGFYDRSVEQESTDGHAYRCNGELGFRVVTRYQVTGTVVGSKFVLHEREFEVLQGGPCDDGQRRLDAYQGVARSGKLHLLWGVGRQVLRRARPVVPTQRF